MDSGQVLIHFQPVWALGPDGPTLHGYEALIRWQHPERGLVPPMSSSPPPRKAA